MAHISTHVLDIALGRPAEGLRVDLLVSREDQFELIRSDVTNADGRTDVPLLSGDALVEGSYQLVFHAGQYWNPDRITRGAPAVFDLITVRFEVTHPSAGYHIPLLLAPNGYTTYRGS